MSLFSVSGWNAPTNVAASDSVISRKRKRTTASEEDAKVQAATVNLEKLMKKLDTGGSESQNKEEKKKKQKNVDEVGMSAGNTKAGKDINQSSLPVKGSSTKVKNKREKHKNKESASINAEKIQPLDKKRKQGEAPAAKPGTTEGLTALQSNMKSSLEGARFRYINELLYRSTSKEASRLVREDMSMIDDYHQGFRRQVNFWPINPVNQYISEISSMELPVVVADLGCGDAALAKALVPKGFCVLSYDLKSDEAYVVEADICSKLPLPGSEALDDNGGQVVDIVVCALSLMSTNWVQCIRETWRVLKPGGKLKIAEVTSRFEDMDAFVELVKAVGYRFNTKDVSNTHFTKFEFTKTARKGADLDWKALDERGKLLKPCEYKRR